MSSIQRFRSSVWYRIPPRIEALLGWYKVGCSGLRHFASKILLRCYLAYFRVHSLKPRRCVYFIDTFWMTEVDKSSRGVKNDCNCLNIKIPDSGKEKSSACFPVSQRTTTWTRTHWIHSSRHQLESLFEKNSIRLACSAKTDFST